MLTVHVFKTLMSVYIPCPEKNLVSLNNFNKFKRNFTTFVSKAYLQNNVWQKL